MSLPANTSALRLLILLAATAWVLGACESSSASSNGNNPVGSDAATDTADASDSTDADPTECSTPNPVGCSASACEAGMVCDTSVGCEPSSCSCVGGDWLCTDDCGGGTCVPESEPILTPCPEPNPQACAGNGCPDGQVCDENIGSGPSSCDCDTTTGNWGCTADVHFGECVAEGALSCAGDSPVGCVVTGCPDGRVCDQAEGCNPSECGCDGGIGDWVCTDDCGGGTCVLESADLCATPNPAGCVQNGCESGFNCDTSQGCESSHCECDPITGWSCTDDCSGGQCVADGAACTTPNPAGCVEQGCETGFTCDPTQDCLASYCECGVGGEWVCSKDCGGGVCVPDGSSVCGANPQGCIDTGCPDDGVCATSLGCISSSCSCDEESGDWLCTDDCGGGVCLPLADETCPTDQVQTWEGCKTCADNAAAVAAIESFYRAAFGTCSVAADCTLVPADTACAGACPVSVGVLWTDDYAAVLSEISGGYCKDSPEVCGYSSPSCAAATPVCTAGSCGITF